LILVIYRHATSERDRKIAAGMDKRIAKNQGKKAGGRKRRKRGDDGKPAWRHR
jgi:hypothetical protein